MSGVLHLKKVQGGFLLEEELKRLDVIELDVLVDLRG